MNKLYCLIVLFLVLEICEAQNLVPNPGFEQYTSCPSYLSQFNLVSDWMNPATNIIGISGTPDYFNQCSTGNVGVPANNNGYQWPHGGMGYCLIGVFINGSTDFREYIEVPLTSTLSPGSCYHFEMYINLTNNCAYTTDDIGVYFSSVAITGINNSLPLPYTPQILNTTGLITDTLNWTLISGDYTAAGGEGYLIIGSFNPDAVAPATLINSNAPLAQAAFFIDDVSLTICTGVEDLNNVSAANVYPNPFVNELQIETNSNEQSEIVLYDMASKKLLTQEFTNNVVLNTSQLSSGIYFYEIQTKNGPDSYRVFKKGKVVKE